MKTKRIILTIIGAVAACTLGLCLVACDGGGEDPTPTPTPAPTPAPDPTPAPPAPTPAPEKAVTVTQRRDIQGPQRQYHPVLLFVAKGRRA